MVMASSSSSSSSSSSLYLMLTCLLPYCVTAQIYTNITVGSSITAGISNGSGDDNTYSWASPSGDFALGFQQLAGTDPMFLLAIWFNKIPDGTIVWSANRENPVRQGSRAVLTRGGQFVLTDPQGKEVWAATYSGSGVAYAAMLDTGNLVLVSSTDSTTYLWQSFDNPTDTILPTQLLSQGNRLVARYSETNYSSGRFELVLKTDGDLALYTRAYPQDRVNNDHYWSTNTVGSGYQVVFNQSGYVYVAARNGSMLNLVASSNGAASASSQFYFYQRAILEYDGVFRQYVYPIPKANTNGTGTWSLRSNPIPSDICLNITESRGPGACGFNSYCVLGTDQRPRCHCPHGYSFLDPNNEWNGCKQDFVPQTCDGSMEGASRFVLRDMPNVNWPGSDYQLLDSVDEDGCRQACLDDCFCAVSVFGISGCWKKKLPLSNGRFGPSETTKALIKVRQENLTCESVVRDGSNNNNHRSTLILIGSLLLSSSLLLNFLLLITTLFLIARFNDKRKKMLQLLPTIMKGMSTLRCFTYKQLEEASSKFKEELGRGAFSTVYKGVLDIGERKLVAIKKLEKVVTEGEQEFQAEMDTIGKTSHKNLVQLLGFCNEGRHRLLVYEYMSNGSLADWLFGNSRPNWHVRKQIALGTGRGLVYLHEECSNQIIHCDIKPQNILLDESFAPRISDFGLAKLLKTDQTRTMTGIRGTKGYVANEWFKNIAITAKVDVYSFGIVLLELICCRKSFEQNIEDERQMVLADWVHDCYGERALRVIVENDEEALEDIGMVEKFVMVAIWCIQEDPSLRPTMKKVVQMLEGDLHVPLPPPPCFIS